MARNFILLFVFCLLSFSCEADNSVMFPVNGTTSALSGGSKEARYGLLDFSKHKKFEYRFDESFSVPANSSLEIEYEINQKSAASVASDTYYLILDMGSASWRLPADTNGVRYAVPVHDSFDGHFSIVWETAGEKKDAPVLRIIAVRFTDRWFGFNKNTDEYDLYTPFVNANNDGSYKIDVPPVFMTDGYFTEIEVFFSGEKRAVTEFTGKKIETYPGNNLIFIPTGLFAHAPHPQDAMFVRITRWE